MRTFSLLVTAMLAATNLGAAAAPKSTKPTAAAHNVDLVGMDHTVRPGDDFFRFANGHWLDTT